MTLDVILQARHALEDEMRVYTPKYGVLYETLSKTPIPRAARPGI